MEQRRDIVRKFVSLGLGVVDACGVAGVSRGAYYYRPKGTPRGKRPESTAPRHDGSRWDVSLLLKDIREALDPEFHNYGYRTTTAEMVSRGWAVNPKRINRLMRQEGLLQPKPTGGAARLQRVCITSPPIEKPFGTVEIDLKYMYVHGLGRNALLASLLDTSTRLVPVWMLELSVQNKHVALMVEKLLAHPVVAPLVEGRNVSFMLRSDNGPQFKAKSLADYLSSVHVSHEFIKPATPKENGHIESFHSTLEKRVCREYTFDDLNHAQTVMTRFFHAYNNTRRMPVLAYQPPVRLLHLWLEGRVGVRLNQKRRNQEFYFLEKPSGKLPGPSVEVVSPNSLNYSSFNAVRITIKK